MLYLWALTYTVPVFTLRNAKFKLTWQQYYIRIRGSVVSIGTGYGLEDRGVGVRAPVRSRMFSSTNRPDRLWGPPSLLSNGYRGIFLRG
jgi:hypothetical protein